ncbi:MAG: hypothetical protein QN178_17610 [Armatimonadota bacterium]|nr:hypothetical protein [Armatimonadota bacterium]
MASRVFRAYNRLMQRYSSLWFRPVLGTPPVEATPGAAVTVYTPLNRTACRPYLAGIKSLLRFLPEVAVAVQDDGSLTADQKSELAAHVKGIAIYDRASLDAAIQAAVPQVVLSALPPLDRCHVMVPLKLLGIFARYHQQRVVLFDSDILCLRRPDFIVDWIVSRPACDFYGGGGSLLAPVFRTIGFGFQAVDIDNFNSGLVGLHNDFPFGLLGDVIGRVRAFDERLFGNWEIEQAIWAVLFDRKANAVNLDTLGAPYIGSGWRHYRELRERAVFAHFVGAIRFKNLRYLRLAYDVIRELKDTHP